MDLHLLQVLSMDLHLLEVVDEFALVGGFVDGIALVGGFVDGFALVGGFVDEAALVAGFVDGIALVGGFVDGIALVGGCRWNCTCWRLSMNLQLLVGMKFHLWVVFIGISASQGRAKKEKRCIHTNVHGRPWLEPTSSTTCTKLRQ